MENNYKLSKSESITLLIIIMINKLILNLPYNIIELTKSGSIINILYIGIIDFIFLVVILKLLKPFDNQDIIDVSEILGGKYLKYIVSIISIALFLLAAYITVIDFSNVLYTIYFSNFDMIYIILFFIIGVLIANLTGFKSIINTCSFIVSFTIISVIITLINTQSDLTITNFTPILGTSIKNTFVNGLSNCFAMYILVYVFFLKPLINKQEEFVEISVKGYLISFVLLLLTTISMQSLFISSSDSKPINSLFLLAREIEFGSFLQRIDAIFIFIWILSIFSYLSATLFIISKIIKKVFNIQDEKMLSYSLSNILLGLTLIPINTSLIHYIESNIYKYSILIYIFGICFITLLLGYLKKRKADLKQ